MIESIPDHSKRRYYQEIEYLCYDYWKALQFRELVILYKKASKLASASQYFKPATKVKITAEVLKSIL